MATYKKLEGASSSHKVATLILFFTINYRIVVKKWSKKTTAFNSETFHNQFKKHSVVTNSRKVEKVNTKNFLRFISSEKPQ